MSTSKIRLAHPRETYLSTLYGKALDARAPRSILHDTHAARVVEQIDLDFRQLRLPSGGEVTLPLRALHLDTWAREFLAAHPAATVLHLGCGLDSRVFRLDPPPSVRWLDVDKPEVVALRRQLYPQRPGYELVEAQLADPGWLERTSRELPVLVVAEGLTMYLPEPVGLSLLRRITQHFPAGQLVFDAYARLTTRVISLASKLSPTPVELPWGIDDPRLLEREVPGLQLMDAVPFLTLPELVARLGRTRAQRAVYRLIGAVPKLRNSILHLRYGF